MKTNKLYVFYLLLEQPVSKQEIISKLNITSDAFDYCVRDIRLMFSEFNLHHLDLVYSKTDQKYRIIKTNRGELKK